MAGFVQIIEVRTSRIDEIRKMVDDFRASTEGKRTAVRSTICADRDRPGVYLNLVEFPSYDEAMRNSQLPETQQFAEQLAKLCDEPPTFRNLDVVQRTELG